MLFAGGGHDGPPLFRIRSALDGLVEHMGLDVIGVDGSEFVLQLVAVCIRLHLGLVEIICPAINSLLQTSSAFTGLVICPSFKMLSKKACQLDISCQPQPCRLSMSPRKTLICWRIDVVPELRSKI